MKEKELIELLKKGDKTVLTDLYKKHKTAFAHYAKRFSVADEELLDIYHDATIILFENAIDGKLDHIKCSLKTYLFSIGKNMIYEQLRKTKRTAIIKLELADEQYDEIIEVEEIQLNHHQSLLKNAFQKLGERCQKILTLFYYNGYSLEEIKNSLSYKKKDVVKSQKSRCLAQLKSMIKN